MAASGPAPAAMACTSPPGLGRPFFRPAGPVLRCAAVLALGVLTPWAGVAQDRAPGVVSGPPGQDVAGLHMEIERLHGRVDELGIELQRQERMLGALAARMPDAAGARAPDGPGGSVASGAPAADVANPALRPVRRDAAAAKQASPAVPPDSTASALIVMVGNDGALTLEGRPAALPTLGYALRAAAGGDATRRVVVGAEPKASPAQVGEVVSAVSQSGFGRITITGP
jgi:biopolymer transport protein ExbD